MTQDASKPPPGQTATAADNPEERDPLDKLFRMSRTAGLGSGDYSAINPLAVAALFFGIASALVIYGWFLLAVPATAVILAVLALRQIATSNGTQVGRALAVGGLLLALGLGGWQLASGAIEEQQTRADRQAITDLVDHLSRSIVAQDYKDAYSLYNSRFTALYDFNQFQQKFKIRHDSSFYGPIKSIKWNGRVQFDVAAEPGDELAIAVVLIDAPHLLEPDRERLFLHRTNGQWSIEGMPDLFVPPRPTPSAPPPR
jgi:hypothetical protein